MSKREANRATADRYRLAGHSFVLVWDFMGQQLNLKNSDLAVYARIFGFANAGKAFYETKGGTAKFFGLTERAVFASVGRLKTKGLIEEVEPCEEAIRIGSKCYLPSAGPLAEIGILPSVHEEAAYEGASPHEERSGTSPPRHEGRSCQAGHGYEVRAGADVHELHPIPKESNKHFE